MTTRKTRILVTGGAGFVGSHLTELLHGEADVAVLDDFSRGRREWLPAELSETRAVDVREAADVLQLFSDFRPQCVVHLAAMHFIPAVDDAPELAEAVNVRGTQNVADAIRQFPVEQIVFASTAAVYPDSPEALSEDDPVGPIDLYGRTKVAGEAILGEVAADVGAIATFARLFNVVGPRETNPHVVPEIIDQVRGGADEVSLGNVDTKRDFIDVRDVASALHVLVDRREPGVTACNVGSGSTVSPRDTVALCAEILGREITIRLDPARTRKVDRQVLLSDNRQLLSYGWRARYAFRDTLADLLNS